VPFKKKEEVLLTFTKQHYANKVKSFPKDFCFNMFLLFYLVGVAGDLFQF